MVYSSQCSAFCAVLEVASLFLSYAEVYNVSPRQVSLSYSLWPAAGIVAKNGQYASAASTYGTFEHSSQPNNQAYHTI